MRKDEPDVGYMSVADRYADFINGVVFEGAQVIKPQDVKECDTQTGLWKINTPSGNTTKKQRDLLRRLVFGTRFTIIGIENQEEVHYLMPLRVRDYDVSEYERQAVAICKELQEQKGLTAGEFLSGFKKTSKLVPCVTFVLYYGKEWDGSRDLHGLFDFSGLPAKLIKYVSNYPIHLIEVRKFENTDVFKTDLKLVFDFIRYSEDKKRLQRLVEENEEYRNLEEDAYEMMVVHTNSEQFISMKDYIKEGGKADMCKALEDMRIEERAEGRMEGIKGMIYENIEEGTPAECIIQKLKKYFGIEADEAGSLIAACKAEA